MLYFASDHEGALSQESLNMQLIYCISVLNHLFKRPESEGNHESLPTEPRHHGLSQAHHKI
jgi:hypothetical protein